MIQIETVSIRELRGIRELTIEPRRENFIVSGPNGSGKSGVVDAIQFALTGEISRLSGKGTGGLSVLRHGPHVDRRDDPAAAEVSLGLHLPDSGKKAVLTRNVKTAKTFHLEPDDQDVRARIEEVAAHPELSLSRREIIKFILVEAGQRSKEIQALLKLEEIGATRGVLKTTANKLSRNHAEAQRAASSAEDALRRHLDAADLTREAILAAVNPRRRRLGLPELEPADLFAALDSGVSAGSSADVFNRDSALRDVEALESTSLDLSGLGAEEAARIGQDLGSLDHDRALFAAIRRRSFVERGLELVEGERCPLCDMEWDDEEHLKAHLRAKLAKAEEAESIQERLLRNGAVLEDHAQRLVDLIRPIQVLAKRDGSAGFSDGLAAWIRDLAEFAAQLSDVESIASIRERLQKGWASPPANLQEDLAALRRTIQAKPDQSATVAAQTFLTLAQDRLVACETARRAQRRALAAAEAGRAVYNTYCEVGDGYLGALYKEVEDTFGSYYRELNKEDEGEFRAKLEPDEGGLDLEVAFYDKGMFPPGAYHSEGHQDGMGVCLYLSLMRRLLGAKFTFAVLDDVVMSVDQGHRKKFCRLLRTHFPDTQFIITTHDRVWAKQMHTEGLVGSKGEVAFHSWSVQAGPIVEQAKEVWEQIEVEIGREDISGAAGRLRRHVEYVASELADSLGASLRYRGDLAYDLGDLFSAVVGRHGELLGLASVAAESWKDAAAQERVATVKKARSESLATHRGESWIVNKAIHWNEWATFTAEEFRAVVAAFRAVLDQLRCVNPQCGSWFYVTPRAGDPDSLRCRCSAVSINLRRR